MDKLLALTLPGGQTIGAPKSVPTGGIDVIGKILGNGLTMMMTVGVVLVLVMVAWGGIQWVSSNGDKNKIAAARGRITWGLIGLIIVLLAFFIVSAVGGVFNVKLIGK